MKLNRKYLLSVAVVLASTIVLGGCKSGQTSDQSTQAASNTAQSNSAQQQNGTAAGAAPGAAAGSTTQATSPPPAQAAPPPPAAVDLPADTRLRVRLDEDLGSKISQPGDAFKATVADDVVVNGQTVIAQGARAEGTVVDAKPLGKIKGGAVLAVRLERVHTKWGSYAVATSTVERAEQGKGKRTGEFAGGGGAFGAIVGGLAGGGKGALIGGLAGAGAGTAGSAFSDNKQIVLPAETLLTFRLEHSVHITEQQ